MMHKLYEYEYIYFKQMHVCKGGERILIAVYNCTMFGFSTKLKSDEGVTKYN